MTTSRESVFWAYRLFLNREPESEKAITHHMSAADAAELAERFITSPEFMKKHRMPVQTVATAVPAIDVEFSASREDLSACLAKIKEAWTHLGAVRPHFSVITSKQFLPEHLNENIEAFWESGEREVNDAVNILARHGYASLASRSCVEYGCGVGRVTMALARRFKSVYGYDISHAHLEQAQQRAKQTATRNVTFHECASTVLPNLVECDVFYSQIVFQHNPPPVILELIRRALSALRPGGIALFQVPTYIVGYSFHLKKWLAAKHALDMQMHCLPQSAIFDLINQQKCTVLEVREDSACGDRSRYLSNFFVVRKPE